jgi:hypothetical protein
MEEQNDGKSSITPEVCHEQKERRHKLARGKLKQDFDF